MESTFRVLIESLNREPLAHIMVGHQELFHSNLLAWFFDAMPTEADAVFGSMSDSSGVSDGRRRGVRRESQNRDLLFKWPNRRSIIIENKIFSLPDEDQLARYSDRLKDDAKLWLLSLTDPGWPNNKKMFCKHIWTWKRYGELAEQIDNALEGTDRTYEAETMRRYAKIIKLLAALADGLYVSSEDEPVGLSSDLTCALKESRFKSGLMKLRANRVARYLSAELNDSVGSSTVKSAFTNGSPLLDWFHIVSSEPIVWAGWQLQGTQFRLAIRFRADRLDREKYARAHPAYMSFDDLDEILGTTGNPINPKHGGFNHFNPEFTYQYKVPNDITVGQLGRAASIVQSRIRALASTV